MKQVEINSFSDAVMFEMQRTGKKILSFSEIWTVCKKAAPNITGASLKTGQTFKYDPEHWAKPFARDVFRELHEMDEMCEYIKIHTKDGGMRISHITITPGGAEYIGSVIFTHQQRMGL